MTFTSGQGSLQEVHFNIEEWLRGSMHAVDVPAEGNQSDRERNVPVFGVGIERQSSDIEGVRRDGVQRLRGPWPLSH